MRSRSPAAIASRHSATLRTTIEVMCEKPLANGITLITTQGTIARPIHSDRRRSPLSARWNSDDHRDDHHRVGRMQLPQHQHDPATINGNNSGNDTWRRRPSGRQATNALSTLTTVRGLPTAEIAASMIRIGATTNTGSQSSRTS